MHNHGLDFHSRVLLCKFMTGHLQVLAIFFASFESFEWPPVFRWLYDAIATAFDVNLSFALCPAPEDDPKCTQLYPPVEITQRTFVE